MKGACLLLLLTFLIPSAVHAQQEGNKGEVTEPFLVRVENGADRILFNAEGTEFIAGKDSCEVQVGGQIKVGGLNANQDVYLHYYMRDKTKQRGRACPDRIQFLRKQAEVLKLPVRWDKDKQRPRF